MLWIALPVHHVQTDDGMRKTLTHMMNIRISATSSICMRCYKDRASEKNKELT